MTRMKSRVLIQVILVSLAAGGLTGCKNGRWIWQKAPATTGTGAESGVPPLGGTDLAAGERPMATGDWQRGQFQSVYFDYDSARVRPSELAKLQAVAAALKGNAKHLIVEGHCDERGTAEYNRALGERRAQAVREELAQLGVAAGRMTTSSFGKDRPAEMGHDEAAWAKNRRCEFALTGP
jgi:peptidoglycan-associated lipoprotein